MDPSSSSPATAASAPPYITPSMSSPSAGASSCSTLALLPSSGTRFYSRGPVRREPDMREVEGSAAPGPKTRRAPWIPMAPQEPRDLLSVLSGRPMKRHKSRDRTWRSRLLDHRFIFYRKCRLEISYRIDKEEKGVETKESGMGGSCERRAEYLFVYGPASMRKQLTF